MGEGDNRSVVLPFAEDGNRGIESEGTQNQGKHLLLVWENDTNLSRSGIDQRAVVPDA